MKVNQEKAIKIYAQHGLTSEDLVSDLGNKKEYSVKSIRKALGY